MTNQAKIWRSVTLAFALLLMSALAALAAPPHVRGGIRANTDGLPTNGPYPAWNLTPNTSSPDFFIYGCPGSSGGNTAGCNDITQTPTTAYFMRYDCVDQLLFVFALGINGNTIDTTGDQFVRNVSTNTRIIDKTFGSLRFNYYTSGGQTLGWEGDTSGPFPSGTYTLEIQSHLTGGAASGTGPNGTTVILDPCTPTAVTVSAMNAWEVEDGSRWTYLALGIVGFVVLSGLVVFAARR